MLAYILVSVLPGHERKIYDVLAEKKPVKDIHFLFGEWDLILKVELEGPGDVEKFVLDDVRSHEGVELTSTMIVAR